ncbi:lipid A biosynthesis lauroyl acyltransferase [Chlamydiifrater phoenicopteri]|uniref:LpxL/LpxP family acyltransferase n=1 Tax=Chlamydiifrater phoenicopteri TaxID=2681469 RepID=UPI001BCD1981|nr:lipid A biosynthesis lauroyl acyltransferase [Chlamydiifrater phoenicopteri]
MSKSRQSKTKHLRRILAELPLYLSVSAIIHILKCFPISFIHLTGKLLGRIAYISLKDYRNTALRNLALAYPEKTFAERQQIAQKSFAHLGITLLEILSVERIAKKINNLIHIETESKRDPTFPATIISDLELESIYQRLAKKEGLIAFCGHQANWELPFLFITKDYPGLALAKTVKNQLLDKKICKLRELHKGKISSPKDGISKCLKALHQGNLVGIVGDQALLMSTYSYPLFGSEAWTTISPAILAHRTSAPIIAVAVSREKHGYVLRPSPPFFIDKDLSPKEACSALMDKLMRFLEIGIRHRPEQWMWLHKRWKKKLPSSLKKKFSFSRILILLDENFSKEREVVLSRWITIFKGADISVAAEDAHSRQLIADITSKHPETKISLLKDSSEIFSIPNTFEAVFDCTNNKALRRHLKKTGTNHAFPLAKKTTKELFSLTESFLK